MFFYLVVTNIGTELFVINTEYFVVKSVTNNLSFSESIFFFYLVVPNIGVSVNAVDLVVSNICADLCLSGIRD